MQLPKLITLLQTFSKDEMKAFADYVQSPYFNKLEAPVKLYKVLQPLHPEFENLKWEKIFKKAFPEKTVYTEPYLRNVLSDLYELGLGFLRQEVAQKNRSEGEFACVQQLIYRQLFKQAEQQLEKMHEWIEKSWGDNDYNQLLADYYTYKMILHDRNEELVAYSEAHQQKAIYWEKAIWEKVFSIVYEVENDKKVFYNYPYNIETFKKMLPVFDPALVNDDPIVVASYYRSMLLTTNSWEWWITLYNHTKTAAVKMPDNQVYSCYLALINSLDYFMRTNQENLKDMKVLFVELNLASSQLRKQNNLHMTESSFSSISVSGYDLYGFDWAMDFIENNTANLLPYLQEGLPAYTKAIILFYEKNYAETISILASIPNFRSDLYFLVRPYMLMAYYEMENTDAADFLFLTFKKTLNNNPKLAECTHQALLHFVNFYPRLCKLRIQYQPQKAEKLREELENADILAAPFKLWFLNKINELKEKTAVIDKKGSKKQWNS